MTVSHDFTLPIKFLLTSIHAFFTVKNCFMSANDGDEMKYQHIFAANIKNQYFSSPLREKIIHILSSFSRL
jgi:hypothetical protein